MKIDRHSPASFLAVVKRYGVSGLRVRFRACRKTASRFRLGHVFNGHPCDLAELDEPSGAIGPCDWLAAIGLSAIVKVGSLRHRLAMKNIEFLIAVGISLVLLANTELMAQSAKGESAATEPSARSRSAGSSASPTATVSQPHASQPQAAALLDRTIGGLANGPAFNAKVRQRVWAVGREVGGIGTYEQAGYGSGRFNLQIAMFDGSGKHTLQQISDGRLAWTRTEIADKVELRRVDVGRLDEWIPAHAERVAVSQFPMMKPAETASRRIERASQRWPFWRWGC